jgi:hypothetical protein
MDDVINLLERVQVALQGYADARLVPTRSDAFIKYKYCEPANCVSAEIEAFLDKVREQQKREFDR